MEPRWVFVATAVLLVAGCGGDDATTGTGAAVREGPLPVVLDYSPTISDAGALLYLASNPDVDLLAVTLPGTGEADCGPGTRTTRQLLAIAGRPDVPVGCGRDEPLVGDRDWPQEWKAAAGSLPGVLLPSLPDEAARDSEELLAETLRSSDRPVTVVAVGPLTDLGAVLSEQPDIVDGIERVVIMGGAVDVAGNVTDAPAAEWNLYIDPEAARRVLDSGVAVRLVPLDATNGVPWTRQLLARLGTLTSAAALTEQQVVGNRAALEGIYLWDELAAVAATDPGVVDVERRTLSIDDAGATVPDAEGVEVDVAVAADATAATERFLTVLNGGDLPEIEPLGGDEVAYLDELAGASGRFESSAGEVLAELEDLGEDDPTVPRRLIATQVSLLGELADDLRSIVAPAAWADEHDAFLRSVEAVVALGPALLAELDGSTGSDPWSRLESAASAVGADQALASAAQRCQALEDRSVLRGGPEVCGALRSV